MTNQKASRILTHEQIWGALDRLADRAGLSASGLARKSGLDPTTFNKSKRITADGRERWPSTESVAKALAATGNSIDSFVQLIGENARTVQTVPLLGLAQVIQRTEASAKLRYLQRDEVANVLNLDAHGYKNSPALAG